MAGSMKLPEQDPDQIGRACWGAPQKRFGSPRFKGHFKRSRSIAVHTERPPAAKNESLASFDTQRCTIMVHRERRIARKRPTTTQIWDVVVDERTALWRLAVPRNGRNSLVKQVVVATGLDDDPARASADLVNRHPLEGKGHTICIAKHISVRVFHVS